ncbi:hypothetical protein C5E14_09850 [Rathayibacter sp. AY1A1]|jgi:hypothetical protein|nr:hypothetical protein C5E14_09850 [Rathayibacter sp. AY1A1]PPH03118.1 hypothetical protein C5C32_00875 [Rathayibacter sp. AY1G9]
MPTVTARLSGASIRFLATAAERYDVASCRRSVTTEATARTARTIGAKLGPRVNQSATATPTSVIGMSRFIGSSRLPDPFRGPDARCSSETRAL